jgi:hypothetical protein
MKRDGYIRTLPWRRIGCYLLVISVGGVLLGFARELTAWSEGTAFLVSVAVGLPISFAAIHDTLDWLRRSDEGQRTSRRPSS